MTKTEKEGRCPFRVAILTIEHVAQRWAGDWVQATKTTEALRALGVDVKHVIYREEKGRIIPIPSENAGEEVLKEDFDVWHFIPGRLTVSLMREATKHFQTPPLIVGSTIFWKSKKTSYVLRKNLKAIKCYDTIRLWAARLLRPGKSDYFQGFDLLLPNSQAEIAQCKEYRKIPDQTILTSVPNGIDIPPNETDNISAHSSIPEKEYVLYPGIFSPRKNQLYFIRALRETEIPVVFMGGPGEDNVFQQYYDKCRAEAPSHWVFLGHVEHCSAEFYQILNRTRVACLASNCETPGIALLEAAALGARPAVTIEGGTSEYYGFHAEYLDPASQASIRDAVSRAWRRGRLSREATAHFHYYTWRTTAETTLLAYEEALRVRDSNLCALRSD